MTEYEITATLFAGDILYTEKNAESSVSGRFVSFSDALVSFCNAVAFGYSVNADALREAFTKQHIAMKDIAVSHKLSLIRYEDGVAVPVLESIQTEDVYEGSEGIVSCGDLNDEELRELEFHGIEPEEDHFGTYFELYPVSDLLYDISDAADGKLDPFDEDLKALVREYALSRNLLTGEIDPSEEGFFCPGAKSKAECFEKWGAVYGYTEDEKDIFMDSLEKYPHGYVLELRD